MPVRSSRVAAIVLALVASCLVGTASPARAEAIHEVTGTISGPAGPLDATLTRVYAWGQSGWNPVGPDHEDDGQLRLFLADGRYLLEFRDAAGRHTTAFYGGGRTTSDATEIVVDGGAVVLGPVVLGARTRVHGRVVDPAGGPVMYHDVSRIDVTSYYHDPVGTVDTDADGLFEMWVDPGSYFFRFDDDGWGPRELYEYWPGDTYYVEDAEAVTVAGPELDLGTFTVSEGGQVSATVRDESGAPVAGARVNVISSADAVWRSVLTDQDGHFLVERLFEDDYRVWVGDAEHTPRFVGPDNTFHGAQPVPVDVDVPTVLPDIVLAPRDVSDDSAPGELSGVVRGPSGAPMPGVRLRAEKESSGASDHRVVTDAQGRFRFTGLAGTDWSAWVIRYDDPDPADHTRPRIADEYYGGNWPDRPEYVWIPPFGGTVLDLEPEMYGGIEVRVRAEDPWAYYGADVALWTEDGRTSHPLRLDDDDVFRSLTVEPGRYVVRASGWRVSTPDGYYTGPWWYPDTPSRVSAVPLEIEAGQLRSGIDLVIGDPADPVEEPPVEEPPVEEPPVDGPSPEVPPAAEDRPARNVSAPTIVGRPRVRATLVADPGTWDRPGQFQYRWLADGRTIGLGARLRVPVDAAGTHLAVEVTHTNAAGWATVTSSAVRVPRVRPLVVARPRRDDIDEGLRQIRVVVTVMSAPGVGPGGRVRLMHGGRAVTGLRTMRGVRIVLRIPRPAPGRHVYRLEYLGSTTATPRADRFVLRIPPAGRAAG